MQIQIMCIPCRGSIIGRWAIEDDGFHWFCSYFVYVRDGFVRDPDFPADFSPPQSWSVIQAV